MINSGGHQDLPALASGRANDVDASWVQQFLVIGTSSTRILMTTPSRMLTRNREASSVLTATVKRARLSGPTVRDWTLG